MSDLNPNNLRDRAIREATDVDSLMVNLKTYDPYLFDLMTGARHKTVFGPLIVSAVVWVFTRLGLHVDPQVSDAIAGAIIVGGTILVHQYLPRLPEPPDPAANPMTPPTASNTP